MPRIPQPDRLPPPTNPGPANSALPASRRDRIPVVIYTGTRWTAEQHGRAVDQWRSQTSHPVMFIDGPNPELLELVRDLAKPWWRRSARWWNR